jgi:poly-beta-1,6-N-acetyl-D-glucosamine synthase
MYAHTCSNLLSTYKYTGSTKISNFDFVRPKPIARKVMQSIFVEQARDTNMQALRSITFDVAICAHNEAANIGRLLQASTNAVTQRSNLDRVFVVSSGSDDGTNELVELFSTNDKRICLISEDERRGKAHAVNQFLARSKADIVVMISADVLPVGDCIDKILQPFENELVGMTGCKVKPVNGRHSWCGNVVRFIWTLHDGTSKIEPKFGEIIAFRREAVEFVDPDIIADEAFIEMKVKELGFKLKYVRDAVVLNRGPETWFELIEQRKRVYEGHLQLRQRYGYYVSTMKASNLFRLLKSNYRRTKPQYVVAAVLVESFARIAAVLSITTHRSTHVWRILKTTKQLF